MGKKTKNSGLDEKARKLYREAQDDLIAARRWVRHLERVGKGERVLREPLSEEEIKKAHEKDGTVEGVVRVDVSEVIDGDLESFLDLLSRRLVDSELLSDIQYEVVDVEDDVLLIRVSGETAMLGVDGGHATTCASCGRAIERIGDDKWAHTNADYEASSAHVADPGVGE